MSFIIVYFNLYDFDNDGKITANDLHQYFRNLKNAKTLVDNNGNGEEDLFENELDNEMPMKNLPLLEQMIVYSTQAQQGSIIPSESPKNDDNDNGQSNDDNSKADDDDNNNKADDPNPNNKQGNQIVANAKQDKKKKKEAEREEKERREREKEEVNKATTEEDITRIIDLMIKESASNNKYIDFLDFRYQMLNTQFLLDYNNYISLNI